MTTDNSTISDAHNLANLAKYLSILENHLLDANNASIALSAFLDDMPGYSDDLLIMDKVRDCIVESFHLIDSSVVVGT